MYFHSRFRCRVSHPMHTLLGIRPLLYHLDAHNVLSVGVTQVDRPAAAPQTGPYNLDVISVGTPGFVAGLTAAINLFGELSIIIEPSV